MNDCILWTGPRNRDGYGVTTDGPMGARRKALAHRVAYRAAHGAIPPGQYVLHRCDVPACVNPDHLFLGTQAENVTDCVAKGRRSPQDGENNHRAKLTFSDVVAIRAFSDAGMSRAELGRRFGVTAESISAVVLGKTWKNVPSQSPSESLEVA